MPCTLHKAEDFVLVECFGGPLDGRHWYEKASQCTPGAWQRFYGQTHSGNHFAVYASRREFRQGDWYVALYFRGWRETAELKKSCPTRSPITAADLTHPPKTPRP